jgi:hypothetical protein
MRRRATAVWHTSGTDGAGPLTTPSGVPSSQHGSCKPRSAAKAAGWFVLIGLLGLVTPAAAQPRLPDVCFAMIRRSASVIVSPSSDDRTGGVPPVRAASLVEFVLPPTVSGVPTPTRRSVSPSIDPEHGLCRTSRRQAVITGAISGEATAFVMHALILGAWAGNPSDTSYRRSRNRVSLAGAAAGAVFAAVFQAVTCRSRSRGRV